MDDAADTIVKVIGGWLSNGAIVSVSASAGYTVAAAITKPGTPPDEIMKRLSQGALGGAIVGSVASFGIGNWLRGKPDWRPMGITMMILAPVAAAASIGILLLHQKTRYSLPGGWVVGLPSPVQVGIITPSLVKV